jgi:rod shape-determining protein MreD
MGTHGRRPKEVFRIRPVVLLATAFVALLLQATLPPPFPIARLFEFPLLVTIYFSMVRRSQRFGIVFGTGMGLLQDALFHGYIGQMGMAKAVVGYLSATAGLKFEFDNIVVRGLMIASMVGVQEIFLYLLMHQLIGLPLPFTLSHFASSVFVNTALGLLLFPLFDRFRKSA